VQINHDLPSVIHDHTLKVDTSFQKIEKSLRDLYRLPLERLKGHTESDKNRFRYNLATDIVRKYVACFISKEFPVLSEDLFKLRRTLKLRFASDTCIVDSELSQLPEKLLTTEEGYQVRYCNIPLLSRISIAKYSNQEVASIGQCDWPGRKGVVARLEARIPLAIPYNITQLSYRGCALAHTVVAELYKIPEAVTVLREDIKVQPELSAYWIPELSHIYTKTAVLPPPSDPVLVMNLAGFNFLIGTWSEPEKNKLNTLIAEFSS
jgi:hypothetical protein